MRRADKILGYTWTTPNRHKCCDAADLRDKQLVHKLICHSNCYVNPWREDDLCGSFSGDSLTQHVRKGLYW